MKKLTSISTCNVSILFQGETISFRIGNGRMDPHALSVLSLSSSSSHFHVYLHHGPHTRPLLFCVACSLQNKFKRLYSHTNVCHVPMLSKANLYQLICYSKNPLACFQICSSFQRYPYTFSFPFYKVSFVLARNPTIKLK